MNIYSCVGLAEKAMLQLDVAERVYDGNFRDKVNYLGTFTGWLSLAQHCWRECDRTRSFSSALMPARMVSWYGWQVLRFCMHLRQHATTSRTLVTLPSS